MLRSQRIGKKRSRISLTVFTNIGFVGMTKLLDCRWFEETHGGQAFEGFSSENELQQQPYGLPSGQDSGRRPQQGRLVTSLPEMAEALREF